MNTEQTDTDMRRLLRGVGVALVTPFDSRGEIDFEALGRVVDSVTEGGADYLVALGTTAETPALSREERSAVAAFVRQRNAGRLPLAVGVGSNCTSLVQRMIEDIDLDGYSALLSVTPYYNKPSQRGLFEHYKAVAAASPLPVIMYNVPGRTGVNMLPETTLRLAREVENIAAIKEASGDMAQIETLLRGRPEGFCILSGDDSLAIDVIERGGDGVISVAANVFTRRFAEAVHTALSGDTEGARRLCAPLGEAIRTLFVEGNPTGVKTALNVKGLTGPWLRLPLVEGSAELRSRFERIFAEYDL